jgi:hypothetical protein
MKAARLKGPGHIALEEIPVPEISDSEMLIIHLWPYWTMT